MDGLLAVREGRGRMMVKGNGFDISSTILIELVFAEQQAFNIYVCIWQNLTGIAGKGIECGEFSAEYRPHICQDAVDSIALLIKEGFPENIIREIMSY